MLLVLNEGDIESVIRNMMVADKQAEFQRVEWSMLFTGYISTKWMFNVKTLI